MLTLYLIQHAEARPKEEDPERPISDTGRMNMEKTAGHLAALSLHVDSIMHSGKLRAKQSAEILHNRIGADQFGQTDGLAPNDDPDEWKSRLQDMTGVHMLVGHLPHLERLASALLCREAGSKAIAFRNAGIVCLNRGNESVWSVEWIITPDSLP